MTDTYEFRPDPARAVLVVIDPQESYFKAMPEDVRAQVMRNIQTMISAARVLNIPILYTEQYPKGLGSTHPEVKALLDDQPPIEKMSFSAYDVPEFRKALDTLVVEDVFLCGMETHICVLQTAYDLLEDDYSVFILSDATCSRKKLNWKLSLELMREAGAIVGSTEIFLFQMLEEGGTEQFKAISKLIK